MNLGQLERVIGTYMGKLVMTQTSNGDVPLI